jgi:hypothetical protein
MTDLAARLMHTLARVMFSVRVHNFRASSFRRAALLLGLIGMAAAQMELPEVVVRAAKPKPPPKPSAPLHAAPAAHVRPPAPTAQVRPAPAPPAQPSPAEQLAARTTALNQGLNTIYAPTGTAPTTVSHNTIEALPQGANATVEKIVLQLPGVTQDSAASGSLHVRNEPTRRPASTASCYRTASAALGPSSTLP